jgi:hypothetical protein
MQYNIKAIPTTYAGVNFRSRLEARWAAFFDLCGWKWEYEPFDLEGWAPDFLLKSPCCDVLAEVKHIDLDEVLYKTGDTFKKAERYWTKYQVMLLGGKPTLRTQGIGRVMDPPRHAKYEWIDVYNYFTVAGAEERWVEAGNTTQWIAPEAKELSVREMIENGLRRARSAA